MSDAPALKKAKPEPVTQDEFDEFDDDFDELAMLKIDDSQFFSVNMPSTTESEVMEVDAPFAATEEDNKEVNVLNVLIDSKRASKMSLNSFWLIYQLIFSTLHSSDNSVEIEFPVFSLFTLT